MKSLPKYLPWSKNWLNSPADTSARWVPPYGPFMLSSTHTSSVKRCDQFVTLCSQRDLLIEVASRARSPSVGQFLLLSNFKFQIPRIYNCIAPGFPRGAYHTDIS